MTAMSNYAVTLAWKCRFVATNGKYKSDNDTQFCVINLFFWGFAPQVRRTGSVRFDFNGARALRWAPAS